MSALVRQEVLDLLNGHLADVEVLLVAKHRLESPPALLIPKISKLYLWSQAKICGLYLKCLVKKQKHSQNHTTCGY